MAEAGDTNQDADKSLGLTMKEGVMIRAFTRGNADGSSTGTNTTMQKLETLLAGPFYQCCRGKDVFGNKTTVCRRIPWQFMVQLLTTVVIIVQIVHFGSERMAFVSYLENSRVALKHLLLLRWDTSYETMPYPPSSGPYAIYDVDDLVAHIDNAILKFSTLPNNSAGSMFFDHLDNGNLTMEICVHYFDTISLQPNLHLNLNERMSKDCIGSSMSTIADIDDYRAEVFRVTNETFQKSILEIDMMFGIRTVWVFYNSDQKINRVLCFKMAVQIQFINRDRDGQMSVLLTAMPEQLQCDGPFTYKPDTSDIALSCVVLILVCVSLVMVVRILRKHWLLWKDVNKSYRDVLRTEGAKPADIRAGISCTGMLEIFSVWDAAIILGDIITVVGTGIKISIEFSYISRMLNDLCAFFLGAGFLLAMFGLFRFISFSRRANILFLTIFRSLRDIWWTFLCMFMMFIGFALCGWIMFGPYNIKFTTPWTTMNCLFALWNGDEVYVTLTSADTDPTIFITLLRIYIYIYVALMTIIALNIFIAIFTNVLEDLKEMVKNDEPLSDLDEFRSRFGRPDRKSFTISRGKIFGCRRRQSI